MSLVVPADFVGEGEAEAPAFDPTDYGTVALWLDATDLATLFNATSGGSASGANGSVARWEDKSGNSNHFDNSGLYAPIRSVASQNGLDTIYSDGSYRKFLRSTTDFLSGLTEGTLFCTGKFASNSPSVWSEIFNTQRYSGFVSSGWSGFGTNSRKEIGDPSIDLTAFFLQTTVAANNDFRHYFNGELFFSTGSNTVSFPSFSSLFCHLHDDSPPVRNIGEVLIFTTALNNTARAAVEAALIAKWLPA